MRCPRTPFSTRLSGNAKETELRIRSIFQWKKQRPPFWLLALVIALSVGCGSLVSCQSIQTGGEPPSGPDQTLEHIQALPDPPDRPPAETAPLSESASADSLDLDGTGGLDDSVTLVTQEVNTPDATAGLLQLEVRLGTGGTIKWEAQTEVYYCLPKLHAAYLTDPDRQTLILELWPWGANWNPALYILLEADRAGGSLTELGRMTLEPEDPNSLIPDIPLWGLEVAGREDRSLQALRVPTYVDKWADPEWGTLTWEDGAWSFVPDGFFTDTYDMGTYLAADHTEMALTLSLRGVDEGNTLIYDRVQVLKEDTVLQTIEPTIYLPEQFYDYEGFMAEGFTTYGAVDVRDINFDGYPDFGLRCDDTRNERHAWFVWNEAAQQFVYFAHLGGDLTVDDTVWQLKEVVWDDSFDRQITNYYAVSYTGELIPLLAPGQETDRFKKETEAFRAALLANKPIYDAMNGQERYIQRVPQESTAENPIFHAEYFSVVDLERDGVPEVVLWLSLGENTYYGFDILRYEKGKAVCYSEVYRGLMGLKQDGTFSFSSGASDNGFGRITSFGPEGHEEEKITWCQSSGNASGVEFFVDGRASNGAGFDAAIARQDEKPSVVWYETTDENIDLLGSLMAAAAD